MIPNRPELNETKPEIPVFSGLERQFEPRPWGKIALASAAVHVLFFFIIREVPLFDGVLRSGTQILVGRSVTPVFAPYMEPTQKAPNKEKLNKEFDVDSLKPRPNLQIPQGPTSTTRPAARMPAPEPTPQPERLIEPPKIPEPPRPDPTQLSRSTTPPQLGVPDAPPPPQIQPTEKPKLAFEPVGSSGTSRAPGQGDPRLALPRSSVTETAASMARSRPTGGLMVGDGGDGLGGLGEGINLPPSPGRTGSNLELLSDPQGVDFRPYLIQVLAAVRRNWFAVIPESARIGNQRGRCVVQFSIDRSGKVPKLVISIPSGSQPLDRAAVAGISASHPFPPLPRDFKGEQVRLQFTFSYNMQPR